MSSESDSFGGASEPSPRTLKRGLYALADVDAAERAGLNLLECARAMAASDVAALQVRAKPWGAGQLVRFVRELLDSSLSGPELFINDRVDVAEIVGVSGVHVGQDDLPPEQISEFASIGLSTHNDKQLEEALNLERLGYVALGPIYATRSKQNPDPVVGLDGLKVAFKRTSHKQVPLVAIGGISKERIVEVAPHCDLIAAIGLLYPEPGTSAPYSAIERRCLQMQKRIESIPPQAA